MEVEGGANGGVVLSQFTHRSGLTVSREPGPQIPPSGPRAPAQPTMTGAQPVAHARDYIFSGIAVRSRK